MKLKKKDIIEIWITSVCAVLIIVLIIHRFSAKKPAGDDAPVAKRPFISEESEGIQKNKISLYKTLEERSKDIEFTRDPFFEPTMPVDPKTRGLNLSGIMWDKDRPLAIINDQVVTAGEDIGGRIIVDVKQYSVTVRDLDGKVFELKLERKVSEQESKE